MATIVHLDQDNFDQYFQQPLLVIDFWAPWCEPCKDFDRVYSQVADVYPHIVFAKVNVDQQVELAKDFTVRSVPTLVIIHQQTMVCHQAGLMPEQALRDLLDQAVSLGK